ncbi:MAG: alkaline phosphatase family protein [Candidatus Woesearchaeota archaeon]
MLPDYKGGSIVNLMSSISRALGARSSYQPLKGLPPKELTGFRNIVLIVVDGLGYEYLASIGRKTVLASYLRGHITTVFPATTTAAITTFATGLAPQEHGLTGWFMHAKELGTVIIPLQFSPRLGPVSLSSFGVDPKIFFDQKPIFPRLKADSYVITTMGIDSTDYNTALFGHPKKLLYNSLPNFFSQISRAVHLSNRRKFVYAYWPDFDLICHAKGTKSRELKDHLFYFDRQFALFLRSMKDSLVIVTADHGMIDVPSKNLLQLRDHPKLQETLTLPLCGEARCPFCYVHPHKARQFERYVRTKLARFCSLHKSSELVAKQVFGIRKPHPKLYDRIGDYVLLMKDGFALKDSLLSRKRYSHPGRHGGVSSHEMLVPLIVVKK